jgi:FixJ family two-component response regulator
MQPVIHVVDDDPAVRSALRRLLRLHGHDVQEHESAQALLDDPTAPKAGCIVLDLRMPGMSGLALQAVLAERGITVPIIFLTAHGDVPTSVIAMKGGAVDFLEKPVRDEALLRAIALALESAATSGEIRAARTAASDVLAQLTPREREVLAEVVAGRRNKGIAHVLGISEQTVKVHRMRAMKKLGLETVPALIRLWSQQGP